MLCLRRVIIALCFLLLFAGISLQATPISFDLVGVTSPELLATVIFGYSPSLGEVTISLQNVSGGDDPRLTAFAFNVPDGITASSLLTPHNGWDLLFDRDSINTPGQFGFYDVAVVTGPNFGGGSPNYGIPLGATYEFTIVFSGIGLAGLTEQHFLDLLSWDAPGPPFEAEQYFIGRFQRGVSDVAIPGGGVPPQEIVPEPSTLILLGGGLTALALSRRRTR